MAEELTAAFPYTVDEVIKEAAAKPDELDIIEVRKSFNIVMDVLVERVMANPALRAMDAFDVFREGYYAAEKRFAERHKQKSREQTE